jgi:hypothetical protein
MIKPRTLTILDSIIRESTLSLFSVYGIELFQTANLPAGHDHTFATSVGFTNPILPGILAMTMDRELVVQSRPAELQAKAPSEKELDDWVGELCNQLLGRIKNQLLHYEIVLKVSIPSTVRGQWLRRALIGASISRKMSYIKGSSSVCVYFDAKTPKSLDLKPLPGRAGIASEGQLTLF